MKLGRTIYEMLMAGARAHAQWELETSLNILKSRKKLLILALLTIPAIIFGLAFASDMLGSKTAYAPSFYDPFIFWVSILIGIVAGLITGCIGAGGGFVITPALMSAGIKGILAVGTDLFHIFAKAIMGTAVHKKLGNVSVPLAVAFLVGSGVGVTGGGVINRALYDYDPLLSDTFISVIYVVLLGFLGIYSLLDFFRLVQGSRRRRRPCRRVGPRCDRGQRRACRPGCRPCPSRPTSASTTTWCPAASASRPCSWPCAAPWSACARRSWAWAAVS